MRYAVAISIYINFCESIPQRCCIKFVNFSMWSCYDVLAHTSCALLRLCVYRAWFQGTQTRRVLQLSHSWILLAPTFHNYYYVLEICILDAIILYKDFSIINWLETTE